MMQPMSSREWFQSLNPLTRYHRSKTCLISSRVLMITMETTATRLKIMEKNGAWMAQIYEGWRLMLWLSTSRIY
jgi:hypothetical protein